jgi:hypothetical protein
MVQVVGDSGLEWKASSRAYYYALFLPDQDTEFMAWHWHPEGADPRPEPHMHVSANHGDMGPSFHKLHIPTGRVSFEQVARFLIEELDVEPQHRHWDDRLKESHGRFADFRTWA